MFRNDGVGWRGLWWGQCAWPWQYWKAPALKGRDAVPKETSWGAPGCHHLVNRVERCVCVWPPLFRPPGIRETLECALGTGPALSRQLVPHRPTGVHSLLLRDLQFMIFR